MSNVPLKDLKYSQFHVRSVYCVWKYFSDLNQNGCEIVRATVTPDNHNHCMLPCINRRLRGTRSQGL